MRVLVTGISGFVGHRLCRLLLARGDEVVGSFLGPRPEIDAELVEVDLLDLPALEEMVAASRADAVVHLGGLSHVGESWKRMAAYFQVNVLGTENVLRAARGRPVVLASSAEVYGPVPEVEQPLTEDRPLAPASPYAFSKAAAERLALAWGAVVVRAFNMVGPGQSTQFALPSFAHQLALIAAEGREPVLAVGNLEARRDFLHVDDAAEAFRLLLERGEPGGCYNLGSGQAVSMREVLEELLEVSGVAARVVIDPARLRPVDVPLLLADSSRLLALGWRPGRSRRQALADLWDEARERVAAAG